MRPPLTVLAVLCAALLPAACGGDGGSAKSGAAEEPKETETPKKEEPRSSGIDLAALREKAGVTGEPPAPGPSPAPATGPEPTGKETPASADAAPAPKPEGPPPPRRLADITDEEVLRAWSPDEREALSEMSDKERQEFMDQKRLEIFEARGGVLMEESGKMEDRAVDENTGMRGEERPDVVRQEDLPPPALRDILQDLGSPDLEIRARGAEAAKRFEDKAVAAKHVGALLADDNWELRAIAASTLGALGQESSVAALLKILDKEKKEGVRGEVVRALKDIGGKEGIAALRSIVRDGWEPGDRAASLGMLIDLNDVANVRDLIRKALDDVTAEVRERAVLAIRTFELKEYGKELIPLLGDFSDLVIIEAIRAMGTLGTRSAVGPLVRILVEPDPESDQADLIQDAAADALKKITGEDQGYSSVLPEEQRLAAIDNWRVWWEKTKADWK